MEEFDAEAGPACRDESAAHHEACAKYIRDTLRPRPQSPPRARMLADDQRFHHNFAEMCRRIAAAMRGQR